MKSRFTPDRLIDSKCAVPGSLAVANTDEYTVLPKLNDYQNDEQLTGTLVMNQKVFPSIKTN